MAVDGALKRLRAVWNYFLPELQKVRAPWFQMQSDSAHARRLVTEPDKEDRTLSPADASFRLPSPFLPLIPSQVLPHSPHQPNVPPVKPGIGCPGSRHTKDFSFTWNSHSHTNRSGTFQGVSVHGYCRLQCLLLAWHE